MDKRVVKTRKLLKAILYDELKTRPISKITVTEICDKAMIGKSTFYLHYSDLYELYNELENDFFDRLKAHFKYADFKNYFANPYPLVKSIVDFANKEAEFYTIAKLSGLEHSLYYRLSSLVRGMLGKALNIDQQSEAYNICFNFMAYGTMGVINDNLSGAKLDDAVQIVCAIISVLIKTAIPQL